jgi:transcriptional regulator with XRE-family HTH domain
MSTFATKQGFGGKSGHLWKLAQISKRSILMAADGTPDQCTMMCGPLIARLRVQKELSQTDLVQRILYHWQYSDCRDKVTESWLRRVEQGRIVRISRLALEIICDVLQCTDTQRIEILVTADRNVLNDTEGLSSRLSQKLNLLVYHFEKEVNSLFQGSIGKINIDNIDDDDLDEIIQVAAQVVLKTINNHQEENHRRK